MSVQLLARGEFNSAELWQRHPPAFHDPHKQMLMRRITAPFAGRLSVSRWRGDLPSAMQTGKPTELEIREDVFGYPEAEAGTTVWHLNFADRELFGYYGGSLLAQDEHQVLEHPVLGSLRAALQQGVDPTLVPWTREYEPTPFLIKGAQRSLAFVTVRGPYGNAFRASTRERILASTTFLTSPTYSNVLAMAAPAGGYGRYSLEELRDILLTAYVGFAACKRESGDSKCVVYTGHWGCGAFGGNRTVMALLQIAAAHIAEIDRLVYHTVSPSGSDSYGEAQALWGKLNAAGDTGQFIESVHELECEWGMSDGN
jgi:hypothetical protein